MDAAQHYLDNAATTPLADEVRRAMEPYLGRVFANPSSSHRAGVAARAALEEARERILDALAGGRGRLVFTSGGTEANNLALIGMARVRGSDGVVISAVEHPSVRRSAAAAAAERGVELRAVAVDGDGRVDLDRFAAALTPKTTLVACIHTQNEIGTVEPIAELARLLRERCPRAHLHVDAVQSLGKVDLEPVIAAADSVALSAHKVHGPKGVGALLLLSKARPAPLLHGGGQEDGLRSGTENVAGAIGFAAAVARALDRPGEHRSRLDRLAARVLSVLDEIPGARRLAAGTETSPAVCALLLPGARAEVVQHHLEREGVLVGVGSACHSRRREISETFAALGLDEEAARCVLRVSLSPWTPEEAVGRLVSLLPGIVRRVREWGR